VTISRESTNNIGNTFEQVGLKRGKCLQSLPPVIIHQISYSSERKVMKSIQSGYRALSIEMLPIKELYSRNVSLEILLQYAYQFCTEPKHNYNHA